MTIVETTSGPIEGREKDGVLLFAGVPYAAPPVGPLRFRAPRPHPAWTEVRPAKRFGPAAPQTPTGGLTASAAVRWDEDCLTLNVCTPAADGARRPVLFWIHGGAYRTGQGAIPWYNGQRFATRGDIVVVSINYRLGALGFTDLSHLGPDYATSGANGLLDQIAALRWVRDNVESFGGDPDRVTIAGESAGGFAVSTLLASPEAKKLFRAAIPQSGGAQHTLPKAAGEKCAELLMDKLGARTAAELQTLDAQTVLDAQNAITAELDDEGGAMAAFGVPVSAFYPVEGNVVIPRPPLDALRDGASNDIPVLTGSNHDETTLWGYGNVDEAKLEATAESFGARAALDVYRRTRPNLKPDALMIAMTTDHTFRIPAIRLVEARLTGAGLAGAGLAGAGLAGAARSWMYWFCWSSRAFEGRLGATHALEIPFAFDNLDKAGVDIFLGPGEQPQGVADAMHRAWTGFIRDLDPGWPAYEIPGRATMRFDEVSELVHDPDGEEREAWEGVR